MSDLNRYRSNFGRVSEAPKEEQPKVVPAAPAPKQKAKRSSFQPLTIKAEGQGGRGQNLGDLLRSVLPKPKKGPNEPGH